MVTQRAMHDDHCGTSSPGDHIGETAPLTPMGLDVLLNRVAHEFNSRNRIFDLPTARYWRPDPQIDLGFDFLGRHVATPTGPAAGPHSQLAQNIVLSWLGGARLFELKTVQILDELDIARPCIDMATVGYNIEWSQELRIPQSLTEYVKASMMLEMLARWEPVTAHIGEDSGPYVFDLSVGYDLAGISDERVATFIRGMADATAEIERLRGKIPEPFARFRDFDFTTRLADTLTLSTFHGCPPDEIERITKHLIDAHHLDVIVKLNPTLLGYETVAGIVNDELGYSDVDIKQEAFADDLQFDRGVELIDELNDYATERGRRFGIKLTNTLVVNNRKQWMPDDTMYLSGAPLHVLAMSLLDKLSATMPGRFDLPGHDGDILVSFSAGVSKDNLADTIATGVNPATVCSDLLKPGGYGRLAPMLKALTTAVRESGATDLAGFRANRQAEAIAAGASSTTAAHVAAIRGIDRHRYHVDGNSKWPREVESDLKMFGCVACNLCITVCPNDAFFSIKSLSTDHELRTTFDVEGTESRQQYTESGMESRQQYVVWAELCNECGNCMTFCPENGDPAMIKPRLFTDPAVFEGRTGQGFLLGDAPEGADAPAGVGLTARDGHEADGRIVAALLSSPAGNPLWRSES